MIDVIPINTAFKTLLEAHTEADFAMLRNNNRPRPPFPYATWDTSSLTQIGSDSVLEPDDQGESEIVGDREFVVPIDFFGLKAMENLEHFLSVMRLQSVITALDAVGIVFVQLVGSIQDTTQLVDSKYEYRATMDMLFRTCSSIVDTEVGLIEGVEIDAKWKTGDTEKEETLQIGNIP